MLLPAPERGGVVDPALGGRAGAGADAVVDAGEDLAAAGHARPLERGGHAAAVLRVDGRVRAAAPDIGRRAGPRHVLVDGGEALHRRGRVFSEQVVVRHVMAQLRTHRDHGVAQHERAGRGEPIARIAHVFRTEARGQVSARRAAPHGVVFGIDAVFRRAREDLSHGAGEVVLRMRPARLFPHAVVDDEGADPQLVEPARDRRALDIAAHDLISPAGADHREGVRPAVAQHEARVERVAVGTVNVPERLSFVQIDPAVRHASHSSKRYSPAATVFFMPPGRLISASQPAGTAIV